METSRVSRRSVVASLAATAIGSTLMGKLTGRADPAFGAEAGPTIANPGNAPLSAPLAPGDDRFSVGVARGDGTFIVPFEQGADGVKVFNLRAAPVSWEVAPGIAKPAFAFNGTIPGPTIRVNEGERVRIIVLNDLPEPTVIHWHGMVLPFEMDGVHGFTQPDIAPGTSFTYEFDAVATGSHWYHPHFTGDQVGKGLYGSFEVVPLTGERLVHRDYRLFIGDTNLGLVFNGKTFPATQPFAAKVGERIGIRMTSTGEMTHPIHLHGQPFQVVAQDGFALPAPVTMDTHSISTAQTYDLEATLLAPGRWLFHCHIFSHMHKANSGMMSGLVTTVDVPDENGLLPRVSGVPPLAPSPSAPGDEAPGEEPPASPHH